MPNSSEFPKYSSEFASEAYLSKVSQRTNVIYSSLILFFCFAILCLPLFHVSISIQAIGYIRPSSEISSIRSLLNGRVKQLYIEENQSVKKNDTLCVIESETLDERESLILSKIEDVKLHANDLAKLLSKSSGYDLISPMLRQSQYNFEKRLQESTTRLKKAKTDYDRNLQLYNQAVIAAAEFENYKFEWQKAKNEIELIEQNQLSQWQTELRTFERELMDLQGILAQLRKERENLIIKAPVSGSIQKLAGVYVGSVVFANQDIAQISPDSRLIVEAYVNPNDIGLLQKNMPVRFQVDAFNYNQWGLASGKILEISSDIHIINERPVFKIKCKLDKEFLSLKSGHKGYLKKGMTLQARFMVTERTLWQLLYDKVDNWISPDTYKE